MAQTGYTPISIYYSATATNTPTAGNLVAGELAINTNDGILYYKDSAGVVQTIGTKGGVGSSTTTQVLYNSSGLVVGSANMTFNGTTLTLANDASISGLTVGKGLADSQGTAFGNAVLSSNTTGSQNVGVGYQALKANTTGYYNNAFGAFALTANTTGNTNNAFGRVALYTNTTGSSNTAIGQEALFSNTTASNNTAVGYQAGYSNTVATHNTFLGWQAGYSYNGSGGTYNCFVGTQAGYSQTSGQYNSYLGLQAGYSMTTGARNTIIGGYTGNQGGLDIRTASNYIVLSDGDGNPRVYVNGSGQYTQTASVNGDIVSTVSNTSAGSPYGSSISFTAAAPNNASNFFLLCSDNAANRFVALSNGGLKNYSANNVNLSDETVKKDINLAGNYLDKICAIPVKTFLYKDQTDTDLNLGVIAQDVQAVAPELTTTTNWGTKENPETKLSVYESDLMFAMMKALQELKAEFDAYKATHP